MTLQTKGKALPIILVAEQEWGLADGAKRHRKLYHAAMSPAVAFWEVAIAGLGVAFGLGGLARLRTKPERGPGDRASSWGLIITGSILVAHGLSIILADGF